VIVSARFVEKVILITGATSGMGRAAAERIAAEGAKVVLAARGKEAGDALVAGLRAAGREATFIPADVTVEAEAAELVRQAVERYGRLDGAFNNVGAATAIGAVTDVDGDAWHADLALNFSSVFFGLKHQIPALRAAGGGAILVTASLAGLVPMPSDPLYSLTKTAVVGYVRAMGEPLAADGIRINALCPGFADTAILGAARAEFVAAGFPLLDPAEVAAAFLAILDAGRGGEVWFLQPGRAASPYRFRGVPGPVVADGGTMAPPDLPAWGSVAAGAEGS
jgi:NAD(P)-dependent dehydrogenase (short-subunit alcohol dehydrogenase family)